MFNRHQSENSKGNFLWYSFKFRGTARFKRAREKRGERPIEISLIKQTYQRIVLCDFF